MKIDKMAEVPENAIDVSTEQDGGVMKVIKTPGTGSDMPKPGDNVKVHYVGTLFGGAEDGKQFDSSRDRGDPFTFKLGEGQVIKSWDQGVASMKKGEICDLICKPEYAYGENGSPPNIPPNSTLKFEVELLSWSGEDLFGDGGVIRSIITKGEGYTNPTDGSKVTVHLKGAVGDKIIDDRQVTFDLGDGVSQGICLGVELAIPKMKKGEVAQLAIKGNKYLPNETVLKEHGIENDATITYDVTLENFEKLKENWELDTPEKINQSELMKTHGTKFFKEGKYHMAIVYYKKCISYVEYNSDFTDEEQKTKGQQLLQAGRLNVALCYLKQSEFSLCVEECSKVIDLDDKSDKAFFRRGQGKMGLNEFDTALSDFKTVRSLDPANKAAQNQIIACQQKIKEQRMKEKQTFFGMFDKFAKIDAKKETKSKPSVEGDKSADSHTTNGDPSDDTDKKASLDSEDKEALET